MKHFNRMPIVSGFSFLMAGPALTKEDVVEVRFYHRSSRFDFTRGSLSEGACCKARHNY